MYWHKVSTSRWLDRAWLSFLVLSFAYERPLFDIFGADRLNPRLFDLAVLMLGFRFLIDSSSAKLLRLHRLEKCWFWLVWWIVIVAIVSGAWLPSHLFPFSLYFAAKYVVGCFVALYAIRIIETAQCQERFLRLLRLGGIFVGLYSIPQYFLGGAEYALPDGSLVVLDERTILGPLGPTYFHIAMYSSITTAAAIRLAARRVGNRIPILRWLAVMLCAWPLAFSGSRTALLIAVSMAGVLVFLAFRDRQARLTFLVFLTLATGVFVGAVLSSPERSLTASRLESFGTAGSGNTVVERILVWNNVLENNYAVGHAFWLIGSGLYVSPIIEGGTERPRIGYGVHNTFAFALEQGGMPLLLVFSTFIAFAARDLRIRTAKSHRVLEPIAEARRGALQDNRAIAIALLVAIVVTAPFGQVFWHGFGTENLNTLLLIVLFSGARASLRLGHKRSEVRGASHQWDMRGVEE